MKTVKKKPSRKPRKKTDRVCVLWTVGSEKELSCLGYGNGLTRTYPPNELDPRIGKLPVANTWDKLADALYRKGGIDNRVIVPVELAIRELGCVRLGFADLD